MKVHTHSLYACSSVRRAGAKRGYYVVHNALECELFTAAGPWSENPGVTQGSLLITGPDCWELLDFIGGGFGWCSKHPKSAYRTFRLHPRSTCLGMAKDWRHYFPKGLIAAADLCHVRYCAKCYGIDASIWLKLEMSEILNPIYPKRLKRVGAPFGYSVYVPVIDREHPGQLCLGEPELSELIMW